MLATDVNGLEEVWKETYRPYGDRLIDSPAARNNSIWFTGKPFDDNTGLSYMGARYYDPTLGRFMGIDPAPFSLDNLHSFNRYAYANNNPFKFVDPDGREATGAAWLQRTDAFFNAMPDPRNRLEASLALAGVALPFAAVGGVFTAEIISAALANPAAALSITEGVLAGEALGGGTLAAAGGAVAVARGAVSLVDDAARGLTHWGNPKTLADHFVRHGKDFGAKSADDYARQASDFFRRSQADRLPTKIDADGVIRVYDPQSSTFGAFNPDGTTRTFFRPTSPTYFDWQPGNLPWGP